MKKEYFQDQVIGVCSKSTKYENRVIRIEEQRDINISLPNACFIRSPNSPKPTLTGFVNINRDHGRSCITCWHNEFYSLKGTGWTSGLCKWLVSTKDPRLVFGLIGIKEAIREYKVSTILEKAQIQHGKVVGYGLFCDNTLAQVRYADGTKVDPSIVYTKMLCPLRVKDLFWMPTKLRSSFISSALCLSSSDAISLLEVFAARLFNSIARLHSIGGVNDTLRFDNVTIAAEIVDLEWIYVPDVGLPDGSSDENLMERQEKEWIYFLEICQILASLLGVDLSMREILDILPAKLPCESKWL